MVSMVVKQAIHCVISFVWGFKEAVPAGRRCLCIQVGLSS